MNYIWFILIAGSIIFAMYQGTMGAVADAIPKALETTIEISLYIIGIMAFWLGIMKIAEKSGLVKIISKILSPIGKWLFPELAKKENGDEIIGNVAFNFTANALGLANAATPMGIEAIKKMQEVNVDKKSASNSMCMLLAMNTAGFQLIPVTVIGILAAGGAENPYEIIIPTFIVTLIAFISAIFIAKLFEKIWKPQEQNVSEEKDS